MDRRLWCSFMWSVDSNTFRISSVDIFPNNLPRDLSTQTQEICGLNGREWWEIWDLEITGGRPVPGPQLVLVPINACTLQVLVDGTLAYFSIWSD